MVRATRVDVMLSTRPGTFTFTVDYYLEPIYASYHVVVIAYRRRFIFGPI